jgi:ubiquinone/menaquinone biosynthesis C-methylase UbiE
MSSFKKEPAYKTSWYDGWFFAVFSERNAERVLHLNRAAGKLIAPETTVLDIGSGTGSLAKSLSEKCTAVKGVDVSPRMIRYAQKHNSAANVEFRLIEMNNKLSKIFDQKFDCAIMKLVLHEMAEEKRTFLMNEAKKISNELVILEWLAPQPSNLSGKGTFLIEMMSTVEHFRNFRQWHKTGGIDGFLDRHGLISVQEELFKNKTGKILKVNWQ